MSVIWQCESGSRRVLNADIHGLLDAASVCDWLGPKNAPVILKPNLVVSKPAESGATTHPGVAAGIIEYLQDRGYVDISIAEGSWVGDSTSRAFRVCGYEKLAKRYGVSLTDLQQDEAVKISIDGTDYRICRTIAGLNECGGSLINIPVLKGHGQTRLTCALKNLKGCIPDSEKRRYHSLGVHRPVALLNTIIRPAFHLVDGLNGDPCWEEGGSPERRDLLLLGRDPVSIDVMAARLLGLSAGDVGYIGMAEALGIGSSSVAESDVVRLGEQTAARASRDGGNGPDAVRQKAVIDKITDQRSACSACFGNLAAALREMYSENGSGTGFFPEKSICIGQDFRGAPLPPGKTGIGICACGPRPEKKDWRSRGLTGCPPSVSSIKQFLSTSSEK